MLPENRLRRFVGRAVPWRSLLLVMLTIATAPALAIGLVTEAYALAGGGIPAPYPDGAVALLLVATPLAALLLATAVMALRARSGTLHALRREAELSNGRLSAIIGATGDAIILLDPTGGIRGWNPAAERLYGLAAADAVGRRFETLIDPKDWPGARDAFLVVVAADRRATSEGRHRRGTETFPASATWSAIRSADGTVDGVAVLVREAAAAIGPGDAQVPTSSAGAAAPAPAGLAEAAAAVADASRPDEIERLAAETRAAEHDSRYRDLVERLPGVIYRARVGRWAPVTYISPHLRTLLGYDPDEWIGVPGAWEEHIHAADLERVLAEDESDASAPAGTARSEDREYRMRTRDGREIWVRDHADLERDEGGMPVAWNGFLADITERKHLESELLRLAFHDPLTGLPNRALLNDRVAHAIARHQREPGMLAMLMVDVDDFKRVNDAHGHDAGDRMLVAVAERLKECVRADATIARLGGDEFAILVEGITDDAAALVVAQRVVRAFDRPLRIEGATISGRVSVGVAVDITGKRPASWLLRSADTAMYEAKRLGKGRWQAYDPAAHLASAKRLVIENELRRAVDRRQFVLVYQPIIDLRTGEIVGCEALIRWNHPTRGIVHPGEFVSILESTGLIDPVGRWVVDEACRQAAAWATTLPSMAWVSVNVSAEQLRSDAFFACVGEALATHGLSPSRLTLEVTESLALDDSIETVERLTALRELGVQIAVDDFGTGYSSLSYLRRLPIDKLKIDRTFVDGLGSNVEAAAVARAIVELARGLHLTTIAEGIEHRHQAETLVGLGCDLGQGYLFAKPLEAPDLAALVAGRRAAAMAGRGPGAGHAPA